MKSWRANKKKGKSGDVNPYGSIPKLLETRQWISLDVSSLESFQGCLQSHPAGKWDDCCARGIPGSVFGKKQERDTPFIHGPSLRDGNAQGDIPGVLEGTGSSWSCPSATFPWELPPRFSIRSQQHSQGWECGHFAPTLFLSCGFIRGEGNSFLQNSGF